MSRKSFQRVTLSVELTLPPGAKAADAPRIVKEALGYWKATPSLAAFEGIDLNLMIVKILRRETVYTN